MAPKGAIFFFDAVVPANAGTHNHRVHNLHAPLQRGASNQFLRIWVPAFAGTTRGS
jgi:hypothetical protein